MGNSPTTTAWASLCAQKRQRFFAHRRRTASGDTHARCTRPSNRINTGRVRPAVSLSCIFSYRRHVKCGIRTSKAIEEFLRYCRSRSLSDKTVASYKWALDKLQAQTLPTDPDPIVELLAEASLAPESRFDLWRRLHRFYNWASPRYGIPNPLTQVERPLRNESLPRTLEEHEAQRLLSTVEDNPRDLAMIALLLDTGMRLDELAALKHPHIQCGDGSRSHVAQHGCRILIIKGKGGRQRYVPVSREVRALLEGLGDGFNLWVSTQPGERYLRPLKRSGVEQAIKRIHKRAGIRPPKAGAHLLRHTFGRWYIKNGGDVFSLQRILGHRNVKTTMIYVHLNTSDLETQHAKASPYRAFASRRQNNISEEAN